MFQALITDLLTFQVDGWTDLQDELDEQGFAGSRTFTIIFILLGFFVFFNMFIAVVIMDIQVRYLGVDRDRNPLSPSRPVYLISGT